MFPPTTVNIAKKVIMTAQAKKCTITTAESCTAGLLIAALTEVPGSSAVVDSGFITYSNASKVGMLGVNNKTLDDAGAVSKETVDEMAKSAKKKSGVNIAVSLSGVAGPTGGSAEKPVGFVHFACISDKDATYDAPIFKGDRTHIRLQAVNHALEMILEHLEKY